LSDQRHSRPSGGRERAFAAATAPRSDCGLCVGWPAQEGEITPRLSLQTTVVENAYNERDLANEADAYDGRRAALRPYGRQRNVERWGTVQPYGWSEDKARQYAEPTRTGFG